MYETRVINESVQQINCFLISFNWTSYFWHFLNQNRVFLTRYLNISGLNFCITMGMKYSFTILPPILSRKLLLSGKHSTCLQTAKTNSVFILFLGKDLNYILQPVLFKKKKWKIMTSRTLQHWWLKKMLLQLQLCYIHLAYNVLLN